MGTCLVLAKQHISKIAQRGSKQTEPLLTKIPDEHYGSYPVRRSETLGEFNYELAELMYINPFLCSFSLTINNGTSNPHLHSSL